MKLFIDDIRNPPDDSWTVARSSAEALGILRSMVARMVDAPSGQWPTDESLDVVSFDHDLGGDDTTRPVILWMAEYGFWPREVRVHSANPVGVRYLLGVADQYAPQSTDVIGVWRG